MGAERTVFEKVYLAGPMRGIPKWNFDAFDAAAGALRAYDVQVISPAEMDRELGLDENDYPVLPEWFTVEDALRRDFEAIDQCTGICFLPGWENSSGAKEELGHAIDTGKNLYTYEGPGERPMMQHRTVSFMRHAAGFDPDPEVIVLEQPDGAGGFAEVRITSATGGQKGKKLAELGAVDPSALLRVAEVAGFGSMKYERYNFANGYDWSLSFDAMQRHLLAFWSGENFDPESGLPHLAHAAWHCLALLTFLERRRGVDNRFPV